MSGAAVFVDAVVAPLGDAVGAIGFGAAAALGYRNYRDTDAEAAFWMAFTFASLLGVTWTVSLMLEKAGVATQIFNLATGPLMATTVAVFAIGGTATLAIVEDMEALVEERAQRRQEAEEERAEAERAREKAEQKQAEAERQRPRPNRPNRTHGNAARRSSSWRRTSNPRRPKSERRWKRRRTGI